MTGCERSGNGAEKAKTRVERSGAVSGSQENRAERMSATSELNISETRPDSGMVTMDGLYKLAYGLSIGPTPDDVT